MTESPNPITEAIIAHWGERCADTMEGCPICDAWAEYDRLTERRTPQDLAALVAALRTQRQIDMDGCEVAVSRQACDEAADALEAQAAEIARLQEELAVSEAACEGALMILAQMQAERDYWCGRAEKAEAALSESQAREAALHHAITEASEPDFIWGAMDNVNDMDADLDEFAKAASRAIRAAVPTPADAQAALDARINAAKEEGRIMGLRMGAEIAQNRHEAWTDDSGVSCDVTACAEIAVAILAKIKETEK